MKADTNVGLIKLNNNLTWDLSEEKKQKERSRKKMWTIALIASSALAVYAKLALWQHNKRVLNDEEE